jgi:Cof subfamily protein (haloacid dehalogenase superfamily)
MSRISLVVSDVDGTLLTDDKTLTEGTAAAVQKLWKAGIAFTIISSRPTVGMRLFVEPLSLTLPIGAFNGSCIVNPELQPIEQHTIPHLVARKALDLLDQFGVDIWLFTNDRWFVRDGIGAYVPLEKRAIRADPNIISDFSPYLSSACKIVGSSADPTILQRCELAVQQALGEEVTAVRSQSYYLDITPLGFNKGTFVQFMARHLGISTDSVATIGDMENDLPMFRTSGLSIAMGNATDAIKKKTTFVTASNENEGFAKAVAMILERNEEDRAAH